MPGAATKSTFFGRAAELSALERRYASSRSELIPVYGRRRVGKTELLTRLASGKPTVYFTASDKLRTPQIGGFMRAAAEWLGISSVAETAPANWEAAFRLITGAAPRDRKLLLVLDEFQWACQSSPDLPSVIQRLWDHDWQHNGRVMLILCGSFIGFMEREVLGSRSPLYGRRTASIRLEPLAFREAALFFPRWSLEEKARSYFICGGIPAYLRRFDPGLSVAQNVAREFFEIDAYFQSEPEFLLREELSEVKQAASILEAVALGRRSQGDIARAVGLSTSAVAPHLKNLVNLNYLEKAYPLSPKRPSRTAVVYRVSDPMLRFWFRFLDPHWSLLRRYPADKAFERIVAPQWDAYCGEAFERLCREALPLLYEQEGIGGRSQVGEYWDGRVQIDVVGLRGDDWVDLGECRWPARSSPTEAARELATRAARYPASGRTVLRRLFLRTMPRTLPAEVRVHDLQGLYES